MLTHKCDEKCACPRHGTPLLYSRQFDLHACQNPECEYAHGYETQLWTPGERVSRAAEVLDEELPKGPKLAPGAYNGVVSKVCLATSDGTIIAESEIDAVRIEMGKAFTFAIDLDLT